MWLLVRNENDDYRITIFLGTVPDPPDEDNPFSRGERKTLVIFSSEIVEVFFPSMVLPFLFLLMNICIISLCVGVVQVRCGRFVSHATHGAGAG